MPSTGDTPIVVLAAMLRLREKVARFDEEIRQEPYLVGDVVDVEERARNLAGRWRSLNLGETVYILNAAAARIDDLLEER